MENNNGAAASVKDTLMGLMHRKDEIESELLAIVDELNSPLPDGQPGVGLKGNLVDKEGFPRSDVDLMRITTLRNRHAILNTDLSELMKQIESKLVELHAAQGNEAGEALKQHGSGKENYFEDPFLRVNTCESGSPAYESGLRHGDLVTKFGSLVAGQFAREGFPSVAAQIVEGKPIRIYVLRNGERKTVSLFPRKWSGQGLIGCHLVKS